MDEITVIGLGPARRKHLTAEAQKQLQSSRPLYLRTFKHPAARYYAWRREARSFDHIYGQSGHSGRTDRAISLALLKAARRYKRICYAVPGHPLIGEGSVKKLLKLAPQLGIKVKIVPGISFLEFLLKALQIDLLEGVRVVGAPALEQLKEPCRNHLLLAQIHTRPLASRVKLKLLSLYPQDYPVTVVRSAGRRKERLWTAPLQDLDRFRCYDHHTSVYVPPYRGYLVGDLLQIMARLRSEEGCPWDKQQTHHSLRQYLVEEAYEVVGAIDEKHDQSLQEELGDVLLQVVFHSRIAAEENRFDFYQVTEGIAAKLIRRHPHVFGGGKAVDAAEVKLKWEEIKLNEKNKRGASNNSGPDVSIDHSLPALLKAYKLQKKAAGVGFDWPCIEGPLEKAEEELAELAEAFKEGDQSAVEEELGDYLFTVVNLARFLGVNPELALGKSIAKFMDRFRYVLEQAERAGRPASDFSLGQLDKWWEEAKNLRKMDE